MLGVRLQPEDELLLAQHARSLGRSKSALVRDWIKERLERESNQAQLRREAQLIADHDRAHASTHAAMSSSAFLRMLDDLDGGYDWGPEGPPMDDSR